MSRLSNVLNDVISSVSQDVLPVDGFHPLDLDPFQLIHSFDESSITQAGGFASQIDDLTVNGNHYVQGTGANQPAVITNAVNGKTVLRNAGGDYMTCNNLGINGLTDVSILTVYKIDASTSGYDALISMGSGSECRIEVNPTTPTARVQNAGIDSNNETYWTNTFDEYQTSIIATNGSPDFNNKGYLEGVETRSRSNLGAWTTGAGDYAIMACNDGARGQVGDFVARAVFKRKITLDEVTNLTNYYNSILGK